MCVKCVKEEVAQLVLEASVMPFPLERALCFYNEGFTVPQISHIIDYDVLTIAYWIEEYA